jgi:protein-disulfide isomerase
MGSTTKRRLPGGWRQRRSDRRTLAAETAHTEVEAQLRKLSSQWRRGIVSHTTGLRPLIDLEHDNVRGAGDAKVTLVEYGDYESNTCKATAPVVRDLQHQFGDDLRMAWRHFPIADAHPRAVGAAAAALAAGAQGHFWQMHDRLQYAEADHTGKVDLTPGALRDIAARLDIDMDRYDSEIADGTYLTHVFEDFNSGVASGVNGCPTFFVNEQRLDWDFNVGTLADTLTRALAVANEAAVAAPGAPT